MGDRYKHDAEGVSSVVSSLQTLIGDYKDRILELMNLVETINRNINDTEGYRAVQVFIRGSEHIPPEPEKVPNLMNYFVYLHQNININLDNKDISEILEYVNENLVKKAIKPSILEGKTDDEQLACHSTTGHTAV